MLSRSVMSDSLQPHGPKLARLLCPWGFSRQNHWSGLPCPPPGDLPNPGTEPRSSTLQADSLPSQPPGKPMMEVGVCLLGVKKALIVLVTWVMSTHLLILCLYLFVCQNDFLTFFSKGYRLLNKSSLV